MANKYLHCLTFKTSFPLKHTIVNLALLRGGGKKHTPTHCLLLICSQTIYDYGMLWMTKPRFLCQTEETDNEVNKQHCPLNTAQDLLQFLSSNPSTQSCSPSHRNCSGKHLALSSQRKAQFSVGSQQLVSSEPSRQCDTPSQTWFSSIHFLPCRHWKCPAQNKSFILLENKKPGSSAATLHLLRPLTWYLTGGLVQPQLDHYIGLK